LFLCAVALAALPLAIGDRPHRTLLRRALLGGAAAVVGLVIVVVQLLFGADQKAARKEPVAPRSTGLSVSVPLASRGPA
jgi:hypothetical protein